MDVAAKNPRARKSDAETHGLEASPAFSKRPPRVVEASPPDIPRNAVPVLRKPPIVVEHDPEPWRKKAAVRHVVVERRRPPSKPRPSAPPRRVLKKERTRQVPTKREPIITLAQLRARPSSRPNDAAKTPRAPRAKPVPAPAAETPPTESEASVIAAPAEIHIEAPGPRRRPGLSIVGLFGAAAFLVCVLVLILNHTLPWLVLDPDQATGAFPSHRLGDGEAGRSDLEGERDANPYIDRLVSWPDWCLFFAALLGLALAAVDEVGRLSVATHARMQRIILGVQAYLAFLLVLVGARWIGLYVSSVLDPGASPLTLHVVPYLDLLTGVGLLWGALAMLRMRRAPEAARSADGRISDRDRRIAWLVAASAAIALLVLPLVPLASVDTDRGMDYLGEGELSAAQDGPEGPLSRAAHEYAISRGFLWSMAYVAWLSLFIAQRERTRPSPRLEGLFVLGFGLAGLLMGLGAVFALVFQFDVWRLPDGRPSINLLLPIAYLAALSLYITFVRRTLVPYFRHAQEAMTS